MTMLNNNPESILLQDFHRGWKATISLTNQVMMLPLCWRVSTVNQAVLVRETLSSILPFRGLPEEHSKSQGKGIGLSNYTSHKTLFEMGMLSR
jgi:hypothetical protein